MRDQKADRARWKELDDEYTRVRGVLRERQHEVMVAFMQAAKGRGQGPSDDDLIGIEALERDLDNAKAAGDAFLKEVFG